MDNKDSAISDENLVSLLSEIDEVKELLRETSRQIRRIERRITASLPKSESTKSGGSKSREVGPRKIDERTTLEIIEELKKRAANGEQIEARLRSLTVKPELQSIARMLGMTNTKLPPKADLIRSISTRVRQGVSVATGIQGSESRLHDSATEQNDFLDSDRIGTKR